MKTSRLFLAIIAMAIVATAVAVVSCKKDTENALNKEYNTQQSFDYRQIEDKLTYFKDFRQKMADSKTDEAFNLEDAAWHLACLANLDFCKINVEYNKVQFDTVEIQVNVTDGVVLLSDLGLAYEQMHNQIQQFKKGFTHNDQNLYFITASISADGNAKVALMSTFTENSKDIEDHTWYFDDVWDAINAYEQYFSEDSTFYWNTTAARELQRVLNLIEHHENSHTILCYLPTRWHEFNYTNTYDPYQSVFYNSSRVFAKLINHYNWNYVLSFEEMLYCFDSYLGLGYDFTDDNLYYNEHPVNWTVTPKSENIDNITWWWYHQHLLKVNYGQLITINPPGPYDD